MRFYFELFNKNIRKYTIWYLAKRYLQFKDKYTHTFFTNALNAGPIKLANKVHNQLHSI